MMRDLLTGWRPIERISVGVLQQWNASVLRATRWVSPTGVESTVLSTESLRADHGRLPTAVTSPAVARDAGLAVGQYALDPQLCWHDIDDRRFVVSPALGLRVSVRAPRHEPSVASTRSRSRPCRATIELLSTGPDAGDDAANRHWASLEGTYPAMVTRWPIPAGPPTAVAIAPTSRSTRLATGPAGFLREDCDEPIAV